jgi:branched-chain amino acid transport system substrate-binding protein
MGMAVPGFPSGVSQSEDIPIGLLVPDQKQKDIIQAALMAVDEANANGGYQGTPFRLVVRSTEGPWGAGSKESVNLVYEDQVRAIVGALDGRNGHLTEQVAAKSHLAYLETRATESSLSQAFVPWFLRCIPNDDQQARAILDLVSERGGGTVAVLSNDVYDHAYGARSFTRIAALEEKVSPLILSVDTSRSDVSSILETLRSYEVKHLVLSFNSAVSLKLLESVRKSIPEMQFYGTLGFIAALNQGDPLWHKLEGMFIVSPGVLTATEGASFQERFMNRAGYPPPICSSFTYDGVTLVIHAIQNAGTNRESIRDELISIQEPSGATGSIAFDKMGNRSGRIVFLEIKNGIPVPYHQSSR